MTPVNQLMRRRERYHMLSVAWIGIIFHLVNDCDDDHLMAFEN